MAKYNLVQAVFDRELVHPGEDVAVMTMHIRQVVEASPDILPVTDQGRDNFEDRWEGFWALARTHISTKLVNRELRFYDVPDTPGGLMGDPVRIKTYNQPGTAGGVLMPPQIACSVTFKTQHRKRWGRFYVPGMTVSALGTNGRVHPGVMSELGTAAAGLTARGGTGAALIVFSRLHWSHEDPETIQVDDIFDVIRRRRFSTPDTRFTIAAG